MKAYISRGANNQYHLSMRNPYSKVFEKIHIPRNSKTDNMRISKEYVDSMGITLDKNQYVEVEISLMGYED